MPGSATFDFGAYLFGISPGVGVNKEDLLDQITNVSPWDTPWCSQAPKVPCQHVYHQWLTDTLFSSLSDAAIDLTGAVEGADWSLDAEVSPSRVFNVTMILRRDIGVSETQRAIASAGFKDVYAYEIQKAVKRLSIKLERIAFGLLSTATGATGSARVMRGFQSFIATNTTFVAGADATHDAVLTSQDFNDMLNTIYSAGGNPEQVYVSPKVKRQVSAFTLPQQNRNIGAVDKRLISGIDFYDSDFGLIQIVLDRWVPESTNTTTATASATSTGGKMFFLQRSINRLAWLRPMQHNLIGRRGDSVAGVVVGEVTLEVLNEKANGMLVGVNNKSSIT